MEEKMAMTCDLLNDEEKRLLIQRYSDIEFIDGEDTISQYKCGRCKRLAIIHYFSKCDHIFCHNCKPILTMDLENKYHCPTCQSVLVTEMERQETTTELAISHLQIYCPNKKYGCNSSGTLKEISVHLSNCSETAEANLPRLWTEEKTTDKVCTVCIELKEKLEVTEKTMEQLKNHLGQLDVKVDDFEIKMQEAQQDISNDIQFVGSDINRRIEQFTVEELNINRKLQDIEAKMEDSDKTMKTLADDLSIKSTDFISRLSQLEMKVDQQAKSIKVIDGKVKEMDQSFNKMIETLKTEIQNKVSTLLDKKLKKVETKLEEKIISEQRTSKNELWKELETQKSCLRDHERFTNTKTSEMEALYADQAKELKNIRSKFPGIEKKIRHFEEKGQDLEQKLQNLDQKIQKFERNTNILQTTQTVEVPIDPMQIVANNSKNFVIDKIEERIRKRQEIFWESQELNLIAFPQSKVRVFLVLDDDKCLNAYMRFENIGIKTRAFPVILYQVPIKETTVYVQSAAQPFGTSLTENQSFYQCRLLPIKSLFIQNDGFSLLVMALPLVPSTTFYSGEAEWTVNQFSIFSTRSNTIANEFNNGPFFYTSRKGYLIVPKWDVSKGSIKVRIEFISGEWDAELSEDFPHTTTVTLVDRAPNKPSHLIKTVVKNVKDEKSYVVVLFPPNSHKDIKKFVVDDSLHFRITIKRR